MCSVMSGKIACMSSLSCSSTLFGERRTLNGAEITLLERCVVMRSVIAKAIFLGAVAGVLVCLAVCMGSANADTIAGVLNVDFQEDRQPGVPAVQYVGSGVAPDSSGNTYWNVIDGTGLWSKNNLNASNGSTQTTVGVALSCRALGYIGYAGNDLQHEVAVAHNGEKGPAGIQITGLIPTSSYDVYLFTGGWAANYTFGGTTKTAAGGGGAIPSQAGVPGDWVENTHYVKFSGLTGSSTISGTFWGDGTNTYGELAGMQIVGTFNVMPTPEPGTIVLLGIGLFGLLAYAWRRRK
jgi:hypothetical protein